MTVFRKKRATDSVARVRALRDWVGDLWVEVALNSDKWYCITVDYDLLVGGGIGIDINELPGIEDIRKYYGPVTEV